MHFLAFNVDCEFAHANDGLVLVDLARMLLRWRSSEESPLAEPLLQAPRALPLAA